MPRGDYLCKHRSQKAICIPLHKLSPGFSYFQVEQAPFFVGVFFGGGLQGPVLCREGVTPALQQIRFAVNTSKDVPSPGTQYHLDAKRMQGPGPQVPLADKINMNSFWFSHLSPADVRGETEAV